MANPQHIEWLLEGVQAWNRRRDECEFVPDFERADLSGQFQLNRIFDIDGRCTVIPPCTYNRRAAPTLHIKSPSISDRA